ncbi:KTI12 homolog, partial [Olea europaea subsp. europaea]
VDRSLSRDEIVIVDSLNSIKGYRYELWCLARAAGIRYCVLHCDVEEAYCRKWNEERRESAYDNKIIQDLLRRATQEVANMIVEAQYQAMGSPLSDGVSLGPGLPAIDISRPVGLPELRRLRRTFIKLTGQSSLSGPPPTSDADSAKRMFIDYLNRELETG